ncbi:MAG: glycosyltransferase family 4 protein [Candidatus Thorarchaeota archaeon]|nr:glycosyltransferase family 4 protein [Candidatus Thorarchaeota archaeon]
MIIGMVSKFHAADGLCVRANAELRGLVRRNHEVHVFTRSNTVHSLPPDRVHRFKALPLNPHLSLDPPTVIGMIARESRRLGVEVLNVQMNSGTTEFVLPHFKSSLPPLVATFHLAYTRGVALLMASYAMAWEASIRACRHYDHVILVDPAQKPYFLRGGVPEDSISVIKNGVDTDLFSPAAKKKEDEIVDFAFVGRLNHDKGAGTLLDAFAEYHSENPRTRLTLVGDGILKTRVATCARDGAVRWLGVVPHEEIPRLLRKADVFVMPQLNGGLSLSVMEAMSCGLPVITTAIGETKRLLNEREGVLIEPNNRSELIDAMRMLAEDEKRRSSMGRECREKVLREYSWYSQVERIERVYQQVVS